MVIIIITREISISIPANEQRTSCHLCRLVLEKPGQKEQSRSHGFADTDFWTPELEVL